MSKEKRIGKTMIATVAVCLLMWAAIGGSANTLTVTDTFEGSRTGLGTTEDANHFPWIPSTSDIYIWPGTSGHEMVMWNAGNATNPPVYDYQASIGGFTPTDVDISVDMLQLWVPWSSGVTYRQSTTAGMSDGYYALLASTDGLTVNYAALYREGTSIKVADGYFTGIPLDTFLNLRVRAYGAHHQLWVNALPILDVYDSGKLTGGYVGLHKSYQVAKFDNLTVTTSAGTLSGTVTNESHTQLEGIQVKLNTGASTLTLPNGTYSFPSLVPGTYTVFAREDPATTYEATYYAGSDQAVVVGDGTTVVDFELAAIPAPTTVVTDTFDRADNPDLGTTESPEFPWVKSAAENRASIDAYQMYFATAPSTDGVGASIGGDFAPADFDLTADMEMGGDATWWWHGITYRQSAPGTYKGGGYLLLFNADVCQIGRFFADGTGGVFAEHLYPGIDWSGTHSVRLRVTGVHHEVWVDGNRILDAVDTGRTTGGYVGFARYDGWTRYDNLIIGDIVSPDAGSVSGTVLEAGTTDAVVGAVVTLDTGQTRTIGSGGTYEFLGLVPGTYTLTTAADGFTRQVETVTVSANAAVTQDFRLVRIPDPVLTVWDTFTRSELGATEDSHHYPWLASASCAYVWGSDLVMWDGGTSELLVTLGGGFSPSNFDLTASLKYEPNYSSAGVVYRQSNSGVLSDGYFLNFGQDSVQLTVLSTKRVVATGWFSQKDWTVFHPIQVKAVGDHHEAWVDGTKVIDAYDSTQLAGGYIGFHRYDGRARVDDLNISVITDPTATVTGTVTDAANPSTKLGGAEIHLSDHRTVVANDQGVYTVAVSAISPPTMVVTAAGYSNVTISDLEPQPGQTITRNVALQAMAASGLVYDTFESTRTGLGATEDSNHYPWVASYNDIYIWGDSSDHNMVMWNGGNATTPPVYDYQASVGGDFTPTDVDITVDMMQLWTPWSSGVTYRQSTTGGLTDGYYVMLSGSPAEGGINHLGIYQGNYVLVSQTWFDAIPYEIYHALHVRAVGNHHQVWVNGDLKLDIYDNTKLSGGYVGLHKSYQVAGFDNLSVASGGLLAASYTTVDSVIAAEALDDGTPIDLTGPIVTGSFSGFFYVEDTNRVAGIKVISSTAVQANQGVHIKGVLGTADGERQIIASSVEWAAPGSIAPIGFTGKAFASASGVSNIGLLSTVWGRVKQVSGDQTYCLIDDGSGVQVKVLIAGTKKPGENNFVSCTGVARIDDGVPVLNMRTNDDLLILLAE